MKTAARIPDKVSVIIILNIFHIYVADNDDIMPGGGRCQHDIQTESGDVCKNSKILPETGLQEGESWCHENYVKY